ncbi:enoyl-CoA hydratase/isomerase family protein [Pseudarthrobacter sp. GA104]|uniref:enoyl-CoA hydratase/isomerase family protein n=1 Tax=Pseudarthrobacter sp. GA104 TaxID=2676311 RepID=UPI0012FBB055|nr:enoyl-CoA hydratase-related protein [Pseudarthrobacter sp. GA104]MUU71497.1 enoyl-CoA hydratase/isomerase family protein [Pseudarthrobacter sp. GA104]
MTTIDTAEITGLRVERENHIALLILDRPDAGNSLNPPMVQALTQAWQDFASDDDVWVVVITGAGDRFFCTGSDLKQTPPPSESFASSVLNGRTIRLTPPIGFTKPVIAAINGMAVGGGLEIALACDLRIASDTAQFGLSEVKVGSLAGQGGTQRLPRAIPQAIAMKMLLTGDRIDAAEALRVGLVSDVYEASALREEALNLARRICSAAPLSVRAAKMAAVRGAGLPLEAALELENQLWGSLRDSEDRLEGRNAFAAKRAPLWKAR